MVLELYFLRLLIIAIIIFLLGLSFLIAGSIMLGIGVSKSHKSEI